MFFTEQEPEIGFRKRSWTDRGWKALFIAGIKLKKTYFSKQGKKITYMPKELKETFITGCDERTEE